MGEGKENLRFQIGDLRFQRERSLGHRWRMISEDWGKG
jgi:hypothetical protein